MRDTIFLSKRLFFDYSEPRQIGLFGYGTAGKTYALSVITSQWPSAIIVDPQGRRGAEKCLKEIGELSNWRVLEIGETGKKRFCLNACDLHKRIMSSFGYDRRLVPVFNDFFKEKREEFRNFDLLKTLFEKYKIIDLFSDFELLLDKNDNAEPIERYNKGHTLLSFVRAYFASMIPGLILDSIVGWRSDNRLDSKPIIFGCDEANSIAYTSSLTGQAFRQVAVRTRHYGVSCLVSGTNYNKLDPELKANIKILLVFKSSFRSKHLCGAVGFPIDVSDERLQSIPFFEKGHFLYFNLLEDQKYGISGRCDLYYKQLVEKQVKDAFFLPIKNDLFFIRDTDYSF